MPHIIYPLVWNPRQVGVNHNVWYPRRVSTTLAVLRTHEIPEQGGGNPIASSPPVELLGSPYYKGVPLPRIPSVHKLGTKSRIAQRSEHATVDPRGTYSHAGRSTSEPRRQYSRSSGTAQHASTTKIPRNRAVLDAARCTNGIPRQSNARRVTLKLQAPVKQ